MGWRRAGQPAPSRSPTLASTPASTRSCPSTTPASSHPCPNLRSSQHGSQARIRIFSYKYFFDAFTEDSFLSETFCSICYSFLLTYYPDQCTKLAKIQCWTGCQPHIIAGPSSSKRTLHTPVWDVFKVHRSSTLILQLGGLGPRVL